MLPMRQNGRMTVHKRGLCRVGTCHKHVDASIDDDYSNGGVEGYGAGKCHQVMHAKT